jgi:alpha,alpha-trehalase
MRKVLLSLAFLIAFGFTKAQNRTPKEMFPGLFEAVQLSDIYHDNKTFVDATPKRDPALILKEYSLRKNQPGFDLKRFVNANFTLPVTQGGEFKTDIAAGVRKHIDTLWQVLSRKHNIASKYSSLIQLPNDFIVPGGRFRETYYWDTYFTMLGLHESHKTRIMENMIGNFAYMIDKYGFIPTGARTYYLSRSQAPFFSMMLDLLAKDDGNKIIIKYQPELLKEYAFWMKGIENLKQGQAWRNVVAMPGGEILNRNWDDSDEPREEAFKNDLDSAKKSKQRPQDFFRNVRAAGESGWDFGSRWFDSTGNFGSIQTTFIIPVDLNCLLYHLELSIASSYQLQGNSAKRQLYLTKAFNRKKAILKYCWSEKDGWFMDYNWRLKHISPQQTIAGVFALDFNIPDAPQATKMAYVLKTKFLKARGLATSFKRTGQQWDSPNGWAPMQFMAITGLQNYKHDDLAKEIAARWIRANLAVFNATGKLTEKYNVSDNNVNAGGGEYPQQDGYGWTNGVLLYMLDHYHVN